MTHKMVRALNGKEVIKTFTTVLKRGNKRQNSMAKYPTQKWSDFRVPSQNEGLR